MKNRFVVRAMRVTLVLAGTLLVSSLAGVAGASATVGNGVLTGATFEDANADGVRQPAETPLTAQQLYLFDSTGAYVGTTTSDADGVYRFDGLADGDYRVAYAPASWSPLMPDWVPTTTGGSVRPELDVRVTGAATADFGWRRIRWSTDVSAPVSSYVGPNGLRVNAYNDAVRAEEIYRAVTSGLVGAEASSVTIRFGLGDTNATSASVGGSPGSYSGFAAVVGVSYWSWLESGDAVLGHEYGHAWSLYHAFIVQQDDTLSGYLRARGLAGDPRVNTSYGWSARELIAEDYRQLLGSPTARLLPQANRDIPAATDVPGLRDYLAATFTAPPAQPVPPPPPALSLDVTQPVVSPTPVTKSATVSSAISVSASVNVLVRNAAGDTVRVLCSGTKPAGTFTAKWDRKDASGRRVKPGSYSAVVLATAPDGSVRSAATAFAVV